MKKILMLLTICGAISYTMAACGGGESADTSDATEESGEHSHDHEGHEEGDGHSH